MTITAQDPRTMTLADAIDRIGGVPLDRIRWRPAPGTAVEQDVVDINDHENRLFELVDGILVEKPIGYLEARLALKLGQILEDYIEAHNLGIAAGADGMMRIGTGLVRIPDLSVVLWDRLPDRRIPREPVPHLAPDLAVEVLSPSNTRREMERKVGEYFDAGCQCVWLLDPVAPSLRVYHSADGVTTYGPEEIISGGAVLPGFTITFAEILRRARV